MWELLQLRERCYLSWLPGLGNREVVSLNPFRNILYYFYFLEWERHFYKRILYFRFFGDLTFQCPPVTAEVTVSLDSICGAAGESWERPFFHFICEESFKRHAGRHTQPHSMGAFSLLQVSQVHDQPAAGRRLLADCQCCWLKENLKETTNANSNKRAADYRVRSLLL